MTGGEVSFLASAYRYLKSFVIDTLSRQNDPPEGDGGSYHYYSITIISAIVCPMLYFWQTDYLIKMGIYALMLSLFHARLSRFLRDHKRN